MNVTCLALTNKEIRPDWCIQRVSSNKIAMADAISSLKANNREGFPDVFRCSIDHGNISNCVFGLCEKTSKVHYIYLEFKSFKISTEKGQQWSEC